MKDFTGKTAFVTGGGAGIGLELVKAFLAEGMKVVAADIRQNHLDEARDELGDADGRIHFLRLDVTDRSAMAAAAAETQTRFGPLHILCNNAGVFSSATTVDALPGDWDWVLGVNLGGVINGLTAFGPGMRAHGEGGHIVNTGSIASLIPREGRSSLYGTSKFAVLGLTVGLRYNMAPYGIGVSLLCPGPTRTRIGRSGELRPADGTSNVPPPSFMAEAEIGMDPNEMARKTLAAIRANDPYILATGLFFNQDIKEFHAELEAALPVEEAPWQGQDEFEKRRVAIEEAKAKLRATREG